MLATAAPPALHAPPPTAEFFGTLINLGGRQRMLSQRIVLFALLALRGEGAALPVAQEALALFRITHQTLSRGRDGRPASLDEPLRQVLFGPRGVDTAVMTFIRLAEDTLHDISRHTATAERRMQTLVSHATSILDPLNRLVEAYEARAAQPR